MPNQFVGVATFLKLKVAICVLKDMQTAIKEGFANALREVPGCLYTPRKGCFDPDNPTELRHVSVFADQASVDAYLAGPHGPAAARFREHVEGKQYAFFPVPDHLVDPVRTDTLTTDQLAELNRLGAEALAAKASSGDRV